MTSFQKFAILGLTFSILLVGVAAFAFTPPTSGPPGDVTTNIVPLHSGSDGQTKLGGLILNTGGATNGLIVSSGLVGIGLPNPSFNLDVAGDVRWSGTLQGGAVPWARLSTFPGSCPAGNFVSAVGGTLTCSIPSGTGDNLGSHIAAQNLSMSGFSISGINALTTTGNVGIGTTGPVSDLHVAGPSASGVGVLTLGLAGFNNGIINSPHEIFLNIDSDNNTTSEAFRIGKDRTGTTGGTELMRIQENGNVGIGATVPTSRLTLGVPDAGATNLDWSNSAGSVTYARVIGTSENISNNTGRLDFFTSTVTTLTARMRIDSAGNVGIGTTVPSQRLDVVGNIKLSGNILTPSTFSIGDASTISGANAVAVGVTYSGAKPNQAIGIATTAIGAGAQALAPGASAFGLNSTASGQDSIVIGDAAVASGKESVAFGMLASASALRSVAIGRGAVAQHTDSVALMGTTSEPNQFVIGSSLTNLNTTINGSATITGKLKTENLLVSGQSVCLADGSNCPLGSGLWVASGTNISNTNTGNVGIGTASPVQKLHVNGGVALGLLGDTSVAGGAFTGIDLSWLAQGKRLYVLDGLRSDGDIIVETGNVGIGTASPSSNLHIRAASPLVRLEDSSSGLMTFLQSVNAVDGAAFGTSTSHKLGLWTNLIERMTITAGGLVGIGTANPQESLSVNGGLNIDQANINSGTLTPGIRFGSGSGEGIASKRTAGGNQWGLDFYTAFVNRMSIRQNGNVGIGTTSPGMKLDVAGDVRWSGTLQGGAVPWGNLTSIPAGFLDGIDNTGIGSETDPTVLASVKDGVSWGELAGFPAGCPAGNFVSAVGGGLTCSVPSGTGDNLGNHTATQALNINGFSIFNGGNIQGKDKFTIRDGGGDQPTLEFLASDGALDGYILYKPSVDTMHFATGATARMFLVGGDLGIGVFPQQNLSVSGGLNVNQNNTNNGLVQPGISFGWGSGEGIASKRTAGGNQWGLDFYTAFVNRMSIRQNGNVGIGTDGSSGAKIEVRQDTIGTFAGPGNAILRLANMNTTTNNWVLLDFLAQKTDGTQGRPAYIGAQIVDRSGSFPAADLVFGASKGVFGTAEEQMRITKNGNVGIGTASPGQKLTVAGVIESTSGGVKFSDGTIQTTAAGAGGSLWAASGANISNTNTGNVGIGTASPSAKLEVAGQVKITGGAPGTGKVLTSDAAGLASWATPASAPVSSVFGRTGAVISVSGDYSVSQVTGAAPSASPTFTGNVTMPGAGIWNSSGNVGIGTASPKEKFDVATEDNDQARFSGFGPVWSGIQVTRAGGTIAGPTPLILGDALGRIQFLGFDSSNDYHPGASIFAVIDSTPGASNVPARLHFATTPSGINSLPQIRMTIKSTGEIGIGTDIPSFKLEVAGSVGADSYFYRSDVTLKKEIEKLENVLGKISKIQGSKFRFENEDSKRIGLVAQEVEKIFPELVRTNANGIKSLDLGGLSAITVEAIKEQEKKIEALQKEIEEIKMRLEKLEGN